MSGCGGACTASCTASACTISRTVSVTPPTPGATCTFDFGTRDVTVQSGGFVGGANSYEIRAHKFTVGSTGKLTASGGTSGPGGIIILTLGSGGFVVQSNANPVAVDGASAGSILVNSDGDVTISKAITADGTTSTAGAGNIGITAGRKSGTTVVASGSITLIGGTSSGVGHSAARAGNAGGSGGSITFEAETGIINVGGASAGGMIAADASTGSCGGSVSITQDTATGGAVTIAVPITITGLGSSAGTGTTSDGTGGSLCVTTEDPTTFSQLIDGTGGTGGGGLMEIDSSSTITITGPVHADGTSDGGCITFCSGNGINLNAAVTAVRQITNVTTGNGGGVTALGNGAVSLTALANVSTSGANSAGCVDLEAGLGLTITSTAEINGDGGSATDSAGGTIPLRAGS